MGLLDSLLGAALGGTQTAGAAGGPNWVGLVTGLLANGTAHGGMAGVLQQLEASGLGDQVKSWVGTGANLPVSGDQITSALGGAGGLLGQIAQAAGVSHGEAGNVLAQMLPDVINHLTPGGQVPAGGAGGAADLMGMLGGLLGKS